MSKKGNSLDATKGFWILHKFLSVEFLCIWFLRLTLSCLSVHFHFIWMEESLFSVTWLSLIVVESKGSKHILISCPALILFLYGTKIYSVNISPHYQAVTVIRCKVIYFSSPFSQYSSCSLNYSDNIIPYILLYVISICI